jgi:hypothetical protein
MVDLRMDYVAAAAEVHARTVISSRLVRSSIGIVVYVCTYIVAGSVATNKTPCFPKGS